MTAMALEDVEHFVNRARNTYRIVRDPAHKKIEAAETTLNTSCPAPVLARAVEAGFLTRPAGTAHYYILLAGRGVPS